MISNFEKYKYLKKGDVVLMDCGCKIEGINTDMTRVGVVGTPSDEHMKVHSVVRDANETAIAKIQEGLVCEDADSIARDIIEKAGLGQFFTHRLGHGIGLEVHEPPYLVSGNKLTLKVGLAFLHSKRFDNITCERSKSCFFKLAYLWGK